jgi:hypothetical protein
MKQKLLLSAILCSSAFTLIGQNGTRPDEARVILRSEVIRTINVLANDDAVIGKTYQLDSVYKTSTKNFIINKVGQTATYQDKDHGNQNDTFYYRAKEINSGALETNYIVIKKDDLLRDLRPGDANKDNICNNIDVLNIGIAYGFTEIAREGIYFNDNWVPVSAYDWSLTNMKSNYRYSDANGDGTIDSMGDISTILKNYNQQIDVVNVHFSPSGGESFQIAAPDSVKFDANTGNFTVKVNLGSSIKAIERAYGIAFTIKYNPLHIKPNNISFKASSWFRDNAKTLNFSRVNASEGELDLTIVRKTGMGGTGVGELGVIDVVIEDVLGGITDGINTNFEIIKPVLIDSVYNLLPVTLPSPKPVHIVKKLSSQINTAQKNSGLRYYLANQILTLKNESIKPIEVSIVNILGKEVSKRILAPNQMIDTDTQLWSSGIYFLRTASEAYKIHLK